MLIHEVICTETQQRWLRCKDCAKDIGISPPALYEHLRFREPIKGKHYEYGRWLWQDHEGNIREADCMYSQTRFNNNKRKQQ